jgi:hypothetical protein
MSWRHHSTAEVMDSSTTYKWNSTFFAFSLIIEGATEKVLQFTMPLKSIYNKKLGFANKKCIFEHYREVPTIKIY